MLVKNWMSNLKDLVLGKNPQTGSILLALDGSDNATRAVDYVGKVLGGGPITQQDSSM